MQLDILCVILAEYRNIDRVWQIYASLSRGGHGIKKEGHQLDRMIA